MSTRVWIKSVGSKQLCSLRFLFFSTEFTLFKFLSVFFYSIIFCHSKNISSFLTGDALSYGNRSNQLQEQHKTKQTQNLNFIEIDVHVNRDASVTPILARPTLFIQTKLMFSVIVFVSRTDKNEDELRKEHRRERKKKLRKTGFSNSSFEFCINCLHRISYEINKI